MIKLPTKDKQVQAARRALDKFEDSMPAFMAEDSTARLTNFLVALRFLAEEEDINFDACVRRSSINYEMENR